MEHIGIDLGATHSHVVVLNSSGSVIGRSRVRTTELDGWLGARPPSRVVMEACTQSVAVGRASLARHHATVIVPGTVVRALGVGARGFKTDDRDAEVLARASVRNEELPSVHVRSDVSRSRRELVAARALLVKARSSIAVSVKSWLRGRLVVLRSRAGAGFAETVRTLALKDSQGLPDWLESLLRSHESLSKEIAELDGQIKLIVKGDPVCTRLQTIPGVGPQVALAFTAQVDDPRRFGSAEHLASYLALTPGEQTTGGKLKRTGTIKAGPRYMKALLVQAAWSMWRARPGDPVVQWARTIGDKRGRRIAIIALARKIATVMWAMWKHGQDYDARRAAQAAP